MSIATPLSADILAESQHYKHVEWPTHKGSPIDKRMAEQMVDALVQNPRLEELSISAKMSDEAAEVLAAAIPKLSTLTSFRLKHQSNLSQDSLQTLADAALALPQLEYFQMKSVGMQPPLMSRIAKAAGAHHTLSGICMSQTPVSPQSASDLVDMLENNRRFRYVRLMDCGLDDDMMIALAERGAKLPDIVNFHLHYNPVSGKAAEEVPRLMMAGGSLNLTSCLPFNEASNRYCMNNNETAKELVSKLSFAHKQERSEDVLTHAQAVARLPAMRHTKRIQSDPAISPWDRAEEYLRELPQLDENLDILRANDKGQCPAENPRLWHEAEATFQKLEQAGITIDNEWLQQTTARGDSLLHCALTCDAFAVIPALNKRGIQVQGKMLLDAHNQPNHTLANMIQQNSCNAIFQHDNWRGGKASEARGLLQTLPTPERSRVGNAYQLLARLQAEQPRSALGR